MAETSAQKRERQYQEAVEAAKVRRNPQLYQEDSQAMDSGNRQGRGGNVAPAQLINAKLRKQYLDDVESGATNLDYLEYAKDREHGVR